MFYNNDDMRQDMEYGDNIDINITNSNMNTNTNSLSNQNFDMDDNQTMNYGMTQGPIIEPGRERVIQRNIVHEVRQV